MKRVHSLFSMMAAAVLAVASPVLAQDPPRTGWGDPDLQGVWDFRTLTPLHIMNLVGRSIPGYGLVQHAADGGAISGGNSLLQHHEPRLNSLPWWSLFVTSHDASPLLDHHYCAWLV